MKINIFFFSKWKWKADALIQRLYKRAPCRDKRKEIPLPGALCPTVDVPSPPPSLRHYFLLPPLVRRTALLRPFHRVRREETKTLVRRGIAGQKKSSQRYYFIFRPFDPHRRPPSPTALFVRSPVRQPAESAIYRTTWQYLQTLKRTKGNDEFLTPALQQGCGEAAW